MAEAINFLTENWGTLLTIVLAVCGALAQALALFGKPKWAERVRGISNLLDGLAANYGKAKNKQ
jgi:hypothetical protein